MSNVQKFSGKAAYYTAGRPAYAQEMIDHLYKNIISDNSIIADIGSGTGKFTRQLLEKGNTVYAVEPNDDMRNTAVKELCCFKNFISVKGTASDTSLPAGSVDLITVAQAFHWFDTEEFYRECRRILKPNGSAALIWNTRDMSHQLNTESYGIYKKYCPDFKGFAGGISEDDERIKQFFRGDYKKCIFDNPLVYTKEKFINRSLSGSYSIKPGDACYGEYVEALEKLFDKYSSDGILTMPNYTAVYAGTLK